MNPSFMDWSQYYPAFSHPAGSSFTEDPNQGNESVTKSLYKYVTIADIGCGFGGLLVSLGPKLPDELLLGILQFINTSPRLANMNRHGD